MPAYTLHEFEKIMEDEFILMDTLENIEEDDLTDEQKLFIFDAQNQGLDVESYSGRGMVNEFCPSVIVDDEFNELTTFAKVAVDNMGKGYVIYCRK